MRRNLWHIVEWWKFYLTCIIYILGTAHIIFLIKIHSDCRTLILSVFFEVNREK